MKIKSGRQAALEVLMLIRHKSIFSEQALDTVLSSAELDARESGFCAKLVYGVLQSTSYIEHCIDSYSQTSVKKMEHKVADILRISVYQILYMDRVPDSAAVNEAVNLCKEQKLQRASGLVNAVLRKISANKVSLPEIPDSGTAKYLSVRYSHPLWLAEELIAERGYEFCEMFFKANNEQQKICAQVNTLRTDIEELEQSFETEGISTKRTESGLALYLEPVGKISDLTQFADGLFYVQDEAARKAVEQSGLQLGMRVLDACAAPGGKSFAAAIKMGNKGSILSCDIKENKLGKIREGAERLGIDIISTRARDARESAEEMYDMVIADVPCSGIGVIRKKPEIRNKTKDSLAALPKIQAEILENLSNNVKPGGIFLYCTCTVLRSENEDRVEAFTQSHPEFRIEHSETLWPHIDNTDGFFICKMRKMI